MTTKKHDDKLLKKWYKAIDKMTDDEIHEKNVKKDNVKLKEYHITIVTTIKEINDAHAKQTAIHMAKRVNGRIYNIINGKNKEIYPKKPVVNITFSADDIKDVD